MGVLTVVCVRAPICDVSLTEAEERKQREMKKGVLAPTSAGETALTNVLCFTLFPDFWGVAYLLSPSGPQSLLPQGTLQLWWVTRRAEPPNQRQEEGSGWEN